MNLKRLGVLMALLFICVYGYAQKKTDGNVTGHVIDKSTGEHIPFATIFEEGTSFGAYSDSTGHYMLNNLPSGERVLTAKYIGYHPVKQSLMVEKGKTYVLHFALEPDNISLDEVVVTGNRYATKKRETSCIVNVVNPKTFENSAAVNPAGVLDFQPGSRVEYNCGNCGVPQLRINGLSGQYSQVLLDSRPLFSSLGMVYGLEQLPSSMIERVEVVRGGGSALFGSNAIGGTVNIITKEPTTSMLQLTNQTGLIGGSAMDINTSLNGSVISADHRSGAYLFSMLRNRDEYDRNGDNLSELPQLKSQTIGFRGFQKMGKRSKLTAEYHYIHEFRRGGDNFDNPPHEANLAEQLDHNINGGGLTYDYSSANGRNHINIYTSAQHIGRSSYFGTQMNPDAYGKTTDLTVNAGAQWTHNFNRLFFMPSTLTIGSDYSYNNLWDKMLGYNRDIKQVVNLVGLYVQNEWSNEKLSLLIGGRLDKHSMIDNLIFSPRANVRYAPNKNITLRASYALGYRAPQTYDEDLHVGAVGGEVALIEVSDDLKPEFSNTANLSFDYWGSAGSWQFNFLAEGFYTDLSNVFALREKGHDEQGNLLLERINESGAVVTGINAEFRAVLGDKLNIQAGFTYQKSNYKDAFKWSENPSITPQKRMFRAPDDYGYITVDYKPIKQLTFSATGTYTGKMLVQHYAGAIAEDREVLTPRFFDLGLRAAYDFNVSNTTKMQVSLSAKNIFDQYQKDLDFGVFKDSKFIYGPSLPRTYYIGLKIYI